MAKAQVKKTSIQEEQIVFALDIGTRSIIGMVGIVEERKVKILAIEREEHTERAMVDGQIENIEKVSLLADKVKKRLESRLDIQLRRVCVAAAGRALRTRRSDFEMELPGPQLIDNEVISRLEAGAISRAEEAFNAENEAQGESRRFYLAGYTVCQYYLDQYAMSSLMDHRGRRVKVDLIATFLPSEVVESLYTTMNKIGLEVASITLEPIAAINAAIPENLRLLNLVLVDIGAGTSDIAACTGGSVTGYTMATVAGDEVTEALMREYLVDFGTAEKMKAQADQEKEIAFTDILGMEQKIGQEEIFRCIQGVSEVLCKEIAEKIIEVNGGPPSALFLAGGGSKLICLRDSLASVLGMDSKRVAIAGNYFQASAFSDEYDLNNPEYATPLGIVVSAGLNMINDSFRVILNGKPAKLFRSGSFTALNLLMMNGYGFSDIMGRPGVNVAVTVNGQRKVFYGTPSEPAALSINGREGKLSQIIHAGDNIDFVPAKAGKPARACLGDIEGAATCEELMLNGSYAFLETPLKNGDVIRIRSQEDGKSQEEEPGREDEAKREEEKAPELEKAAESRNGKAEKTVAAEEDKHGTGRPVERAEEAAGRMERPVERIERPAERIERPVERVERPVERIERPAERTERPIERVERPAERIERPAERAERPIERVERPAERTERPVERVERPVERTERPVERVERPIERVERPVERTERPVERVERPVERVERPVERVERPVERTERPAERMERPAERTEMPVERTEMPLAGNFVQEVKQEPEEKPVMIRFWLNGSIIRLPRKKDGSPYYLMDMIQYSGLDLKNPQGSVSLTVNGIPGSFQQALREGDVIVIGVEKR